MAQTQPANGEQNLSLKLQQEKHVHGKFRLGLCLAHIQSIRNLA